MDKEKLQMLNYLYAQALSILDIIDNATKQFKKAFDVKDYLNPFDKRFDVKRLVKSIRNSLVRFAIEEINQTNTPIDDKGVIKFLNEELGELGFDAIVLKKHIEEEYLSRADELSLEEITRKALRFMPICYGKKGIRVPKLNELVKKDRLFLRYYINWSYDIPFLFDFLRDVLALEQFIYIVVRRARPSTVKGGFINSAYWNARTQEQVLERKLIPSRIIESTKIYKNGKFEIQFTKEAYARKVARALIRAEAKRLA